MADSIRQLIINAIDSRLKLITIANGYETNIGGKVFEWRAVPVEEIDLPCIIYRDLSSVNSVLTIGIGGYHESNLNIEVEVICAAGSVTPSTIRKMLADVIKAIGVDATWSGLASSTDPVSDAITIEQNEKIIGGANITFTITYRTKRWDAYNQ